MRLNKFIFSFLVALTSLVVTSFLHLETQFFDPCLASISVGFLGTFFLENKELQKICFLSSFVGMSLFSSAFFYIFCSFFSLIFFFLLKKKFNGVGGKLGATAFLSVITYIFLGRL